MAHNIWNGRFYNKDRRPAWHGLGINSEAAITAEQAFDLTGEYKVGLAPLSANHNGQMIGTDYSIIVREPTADDPTTKVFGSPVSKNYELIGPRESAQIWDKGVGNTAKKIASPTETFGVLRGGQEVFITTMIKEFSIQGDETQVYEFMYSPMYSGKAAIVGVTGIRVVCANTLKVGLQQATQRYYINHLPGAKDSMAKFIKEMHGRNAMTTDVMKEAFELMAKRKVTEREVLKNIQWIYPDPEMPDESWHMQFGISFEQHQERYEEKMADAKQVRETVVDLFKGGGRGMDHVAVAGTAYGVYNAVAEYETYRRGPFERAAVNLVAGDRGSKIAQAFNTMLDVARSN